jgi:hypothetical protein
VFTNEEVRKAMGELVEKKGEGHTSYSMYRSRDGKGGACFLGSLCEHMGLAIPYEGMNAKYVMGKDAVSKEMALAFALAQNLNDNRFEWKYVLRGVDLALAMDPRQVVECPCGCGNVEGNRLQVLIDQVRAERDHDRDMVTQAAVARLEKAPAKVSINGGYVTGGIITGISIQMNSMTATFNQIAQIKPLFVETALPPLAVQKKDHDLIA